VTGLEERLKAEARRLGFDLVGIAPAIPPPGFPRFQDWLDQGYAGMMRYLHQHRQARAHPRGVFAQVRSVIVVAKNYHRLPDPHAAARPSQRSSASGQTPLQEADPARVARYAQIADYHDWLRAHLQRLLEWLQETVPQCQGRVVVDTAPLLERDFARLAGLGWFGKNTMLIHKRLGSWLLLGAVLVNLELRPDAPHETSHCGTCTACLEACPTDAFPQPGVLDARRCISYLTIELRQPIPRDLRAGLGSWVFGCDICQEVCPWNRKAPASDDPHLQPRPELSQPDPVRWLRLSPEAFRELFRGTALTRPKRAGLLRNAAIVLGNRRDPASLPALIQALDDPEPLVRGAAAWALGRFRLPAARDALTRRLPREHDPEVRQEIEAALAQDDAALPDASLGPAPLAQGR
jgi:epoxyqueuosine reductase